MKWNDHIMIRSARQAVLRMRMEEHERKNENVGLTILFTFSIIPLVTVQAHIPCRSIIARQNL